KRHAAGSARIDSSAPAAARRSPEPLLPRRMRFLTIRVITMGPRAHSRTFGVHFPGAEERQIQGSALDQNVSFRASCNSLGFGLKAVAVTTPKVRDWASYPGVSNTGVFVRLNASARNCSFTFSVTWKSLKSEKSRFLTPSLMTFGIVREAFPKLNGAGTE